MFPNCFRVHLALPYLAELLRTQQNPNPFQTLISICDLYLQ